MSTQILSFLPQDFTPLLISVTFYTFVFGATEICRRIVDRTISRKRLIYSFLMEFMASLQMCTCVYENGVILKNYGVIGFFFVVIGLLIAGGMVNRGAFVNPLPVFEQLYKNVLSIERASVLLVAQILGGGLAFRCSEIIWYYTMDMVSDHRFFYENLPCTFAFKHSLLFAMLYEVIGSFTLRFVGSKLPGRARGFLMPAMVSFLLSVAFVYVGIPALNPLTVSARMMNCQGLDQQMFFFTYWFLPGVGWFMAVFLDDLLSKRSPVQQQKQQAPKNQRKQTEKKKWYPKKQN